MKEYDVSPFSTPVNIVAPNSNDGELSLMFAHVLFHVTSDVDSRPSATYGWNEIEATSCFIPMGLSHSNSQQMHAWRTSFKNLGVGPEKTAEEKSWNLWMGKKM